MRLTGKNDRRANVGLAKHRIQAFRGSADNNTITNLAGNLPSAIRCVIVVRVFHAGVV